MKTYLKQCTSIIMLLTIQSVCVLSLQAEAKTSGPDKEVTPAVAEKILGTCTLGETEAAVWRMLGNLNAGTTPGVYTAGNWSAWIDTAKKTLKGISYDERAGIKKNFRYPKTGRGISVGSTPADVEKVYGRPDHSLIGKSPYLLKNSDLAFINVYRSRGLWVMYMNQKPYAGAGDWRVTMIALGDREVIDSLLNIASAYTQNPVTPRKKKLIRALYKKKYGGSVDVAIYDHYQYFLQEAYFARVRAKGAYIITPIMVMPTNEHAAMDLVSELSPTSPLSRELDALAKKKTMQRDKISAEALEQLIQNVGKLKTTLFTEEVQEKNRQTLNNLQLPQGQCKQ